MKTIPVSSSSAVEIAKVGYHPITIQNQGNKTVFLKFDGSKKPLTKDNGYICAAGQTVSLDRREKPFSVEAIALRGTQNVHVSGED